MGLGLGLDLLCRLVWVRLWVLVNREAIYVVWIGERRGREKLVRKS